MKKIIGNKKSEKAREKNEYEIRKKESFWIAQEKLSVKQEKLQDIRT